MGSFSSNDSFFSSSKNATNTNDYMHTPFANNNDTRSQPVGVLRQPRNRSHPTLSSSSHENNGHLHHPRPFYKSVSISDDCRRMQEGDEGYKRGVLNKMNDKIKYEGVDGGSDDIIRSQKVMNQQSLGCVKSPINYSSHKISGTGHSASSSGNCSDDKGSLLECDAWRKDGRERRMQILEEDEKNGGSDFQIHYQSRLRTYSDISDRIRDQFLRAYSSPDIAVEELQCIYIMGNRLMNFLSKVLPTHPQYSSKRPDHVRLQVKIQHDLMTVREKVEDVAYRLDKEIYRQQMEEQGLEFVKTPEKMNVRELRKERMKRVTFNLDLERIEYEPDPYEYEKQDDLNEGDKAFDLHDLSVWEDKDPDDGDFIDMSLSSEDSSFENSFRNDSKDGFGLNDASDVEVEVLNVFGGTDDGWEHYKSNPVHGGGQWDWPDMVTQYGPMGKDKEHDTTASTVDMENSSNEQDPHATDPMHSSMRYDSDASDTDSEVEYDDFGNVDNFYSGFHESFVEKISRENFTRSIDELRDHDDDSAQDSWAQCHEYDDYGKEACHDASVSGSQVLHTQSDDDGLASFVRTDHDDDNLESSIDGHYFVTADERESSMSSIDRPCRQSTSSNALPRAQDLLCPLSSDESLEYSQSSLDFSYPSSKNSSKLYLSSCTEEWDACDMESCNDAKLFDVHDEFDNSQIIAESPSFNDESDSGNEYDEFVRSVTEEFGSEKGESLHCDSSGGEKTVTTISTADTSCDTGEENSCWSPESGSNKGEESVLGILRRDSYIPTIDSPIKPRKKIGDNLDYLESKVKDLNIRNTQNQIIGVPTDSDSPVARHSNGHIVNTAFEGSLTSQETDSSSSVLSTCTSSRRPHPTAARLKNLRQSAAWKRRYGK